VVGHQRGWNNTETVCDNEKHPELMNAKPQRQRFLFVVSGSNSGFPVESPFKLDKMTKLKITVAVSIRVCCCPLFLSGGPFG